VFQIPTTSVFRVESIVKFHLRDHRYRENLLQGRCNGGKGCDKKHDEWFDVTIDRVKQVVRLWTRWMHAKPYGDDHRLKPEWRKVIESVHLNSVYDPWPHLLSPRVLKQEATVVKLEDCQSIEQQNFIDDLAARNESLIPDRLLSRTTLLKVPRPIQRNLEHSDLEVLVENFRKYLSVSTNLPSTPVPPPVSRSQFVLA